MTKTVKNCLGVMMSLAFLMTPTLLKAFEGTGIAAGVTMAQHAFETTGKSVTHQSGKITNGDVDDSFIIPSLFIQYTLAANDRAGITIGAEYVPGAGTFIMESKADTDLDEGTTTTGTKSAEATVENHKSIYIQPTLFINDKTAVFLSAAIIHADVEMDAKLVTSTNFVRKTDMMGSRFGVGATRILNDGWFVRVEGYFSDYDSISFTTSDSTTASGTAEAYSGAFSIGRSF